jgi:hypothetical protein
MGLSNDSVGRFAEIALKPWLTGVGVRAARGAIAAGQRKPDEFIVCAIGAEMLVTDALLAR